jgi:hypothetical protein
MAKIEIHFDDLPHSAVRKQKLPATLLGFLREAVHPSPDGKGLVSLEDQMMRQQWDAMLGGSATAMNWLLREVIRDNQPVLAAAAERPPYVVIDGIHHFQPLAPVLEILGCVSVAGPEDGSEGPSAVKLCPWFVDFLQKRCRPDKLAPVLAWQDAGGQQVPRINRDLDDD